MRAQLLALFKASVGVITVAVLAACATTKDEPAPQMTAVAVRPSPTAPAAASDAMPSPSLSTMRVDPAFDNFEENAPDRVYFEYDKADLSPEGLAALQKEAAWLTTHPSVTLVVEGHSDERGTREYNLALAARRATAVKIYLMTNGVSAARLETVSFGKERPSCTASGEQCWRLNRRAVSAIRSMP